jgi:hypothetical protein
MGSRLCSSRNIKYGKDANKSTVPAGIVRDCEKMLSVTGSAAWSSSSICFVSDSQAGAVSGLIALKVFR